MLSFATEFPVMREHASARFLQAVRDWVLGSPHTRFRPESLTGLEDSRSARTENERIDVLSLLTRPRFRSCQVHEER